MFVQYASSSLVVSEQCLVAWASNAATRIRLVEGVWLGERTPIYKRPRVSGFTFPKKLFPCSSPGGGNTSPSRPNKFRICRFESRIVAVEAIIFGRIPPLRISMMLLMLASFAPFIKTNIETILYLQSTIWYTYVLTTITTIFIVKILKKIWRTFVYICENILIL